MNLPISAKGKKIKCTKECLDDKGSDIFQENIINDLSLLHTTLHTDSNKKSAELQPLPLFVDNKEREPLNLEFIVNKELKGDNKKKMKVGHFRKALKRVRNTFRKYF